jgi:hypothetical protein
MRKTKHYRTTEIVFSIDIEQPIQDKVTIPVYSHLPMVVTLSECDFDSDMKTLIPTSFGNDWAEACFIQLKERVAEHINEFGRILPADLECYIAEMVLVMGSIGEAIQQPFSYEKRKLIFNRVLIAISDELNIPIEIHL